MSVARTLKMSARAIRCGLISDTHGFLDPRIARVFGRVDLIVHAGDVGSAEVLARLRAVAPLAAVRGNNDRTGVCARLPLSLSFRLGSTRLLVVHEIGKPSHLLPPVERAIQKHRPHVVIYGHSHVPHQEERDGALFINPGSAGKKRFRLPRACAILRIDGKRLRVLPISLE